MTRNFTQFTVQEAKKELEYIANYDELSGLPNRYNFKKKLKSIKEMNVDLALMMLEVDGLRYINHSLGYEIGDKVIVEIVRRLQSFLGKNIFLSRYSDDHFGIIIQEQKSQGEYQNIAKEIISRFKNSFKVDKFELDLWINIGICISDEGRHDTITLKKKANLALLRAKREGQNIYRFYSSNLDKENYKEISLRSDLHNAIEKNQLKIYLQPIVNLKTNEMLAVEALLRWEHPEWGLVPPNEFIPLAEETGCIIDISKWILKEVAKYYKKWQNHKLPSFKISVNFSGMEFYEINFIENIENIMKELNLDPSFLIIEITENILLENSERITSHIDKLRSLGIIIALDDYGTGYSSLSYLMSFNIDILKISRFFIKDISNDTNKAIVKNTINMANELKIKLVAEGIEKEEQIATLQKYKCYAGQGYIFSKPIPVKDFENILENRKHKSIIIDNLISLKIVNY